MENPYKRMEHSLTQSAALGLDVLRRAKQREGTWQVQREEEEPEGDTASVQRECLEEAFSAVALFLRRSSEQCEKYHLCVPASDLSQQEVKHLHRFHRRKPAKTALLPPPDLSCLEAWPPWSVHRCMSPRDVNIEVAPGTYRISARSFDSARQAHVVNIPPGRSVDLTFDL